MRIILANEDQPSYPPTIEEGQYLDVAHDDTTTRVWLGYNTSSYQAEQSSYYWLATNGGLYNDYELTSLWKAAVTPTPTPT